MSALDKIAGFFGFVRPRRRGYGFAAAEISRLTGDLQNEAQFINTTLRYQGRILRARARQAVQNNPFARRFVQMVVDNVAGPDPFCLEGKVRNARGKLDENANERIEQAWCDWGRAGQCEITEKWSWSTVVRLMVRIWATDGELLVRKLRGPQFGRFGFRLQIIDIDRLYELKNQALPGGGAIHSSIELDPTGKAVAYWVLKRKPSQWQYSGYSMADFERIPADEIVHVFAPEFAEQVRGVPMMYAALLNLVHLGAFEEAAVIAARIGAAQMFVIESADGGQTLADMAGPGPKPDGTDGFGPGNGNLQLQAEPGGSFTLPQGQKLSQGWNPKYPDAAIEPFIRACLRGVAAGLGVAYHNLANDLENVNYSSARIGELDERDTWKGMQQFWIEHFNQPVYEDWLKMQVLVGTLPFDVARLDKYREVYWQARRWAWVDPLKEVGAAIEGINARITSRTRVAAENGVDIEDIAEEIEQELQMFKDKNIELPDVQPQVTGTIPNDQGDGTTPAGEGDATKPKKQAQPAGRRDAPRSGEASGVRDINVTIAQGAIRSDTNLTMPEREARIEVVSGDGKNLTQSILALTKSLEAGRQNVEREQHKMSAQLLEFARLVHEHPPVVNIENRVEPTPVQVKVEQAPVEVNVHMPARKSVSEVERNADGHIVKVTQAETDA